MNQRFSINKLALAVAAAIGAGAVVTAPTVATAAKTPGKYVAGDFHNHTTCSDGSMSMQNVVRHSTDSASVPWALDWFVQAGHGNSGGTRNCTLTEDATLNTPAYPFIAGTSPSTTWTASIGAANIKGDFSSNAPYMWRWQSVQEYQYPLMEYLNAYRNYPMFIGIESISAGHEHTSMSVITGQIPAALDSATLPTSPGPITARYTPLGNADALAKWVYCFDAGVGDLSRGDQHSSSVGNNWDCSVPGSLNAADPNWSAAGFKLNPTPTVAIGSGAGTKGHAKTLEGLKWMAQFEPTTSYFVPAHLERAGPFTPDGQNGFNVEHLRDFNNAAPTVAFGMESQPGHGGSANRGEYQVARNGNFGGTGVAVDSVGGTTYGGTGIYAAQVGGVWDALLGEGRNFWFFASSDWHNRGSFQSTQDSDRRTTQDFFPGEYQRSYTMVRNGSDKLRPQTIVDGLRTGNTFSAQGQLIDRLAFVACASYAGIARRTDAGVEAIAIAAATNNTDTDVAGCATMGEKLKVRPGAEIVVSVVVRDPAGTNYSPYTFANPSLAQVSITQPINAPVLDHIDLIRGEVSGYRTPGAANYSGEWPRNQLWLHADGSTPPDLSTVPDAAKNTTAAVIKTFSGSGGTPWVPVVSAVDGTTFLKMTYRIPAVQVSQYVRLRGTSMPPAVPFETDASGNPLPDVFTNANNTNLLRIRCAVAHSAGNQFDGCPDHLANGGASSTIPGQRAVSFDVAAWADLWFYANPIYVEVAGSTVVAGVQ